MAMLGYVRTDGRGASDRLMAGLVERLRAAGVSVAGAVQVNRESDPARRCEMDLHVLGAEAVVPISQDLGAESKSCRLDADGLERAVALVAAGLAHGAQILVINKFGKQEAEGHGFRPLIGDALAAGIPVATAVGEGVLPAFLDYSGGLAEELPAEAEALFARVMAMLAEAEGAAAP